MAASQKTRTKPKAKGKPTYRGVVIQHPVGRSRFSAAKIRRAIENAIAKNPQAFERGR
jgi:hypothetical protein